MRARLGGWLVGLSLAAMGCGDAGSGVGVKAPATEAAPSEVPAAASTGGSDGSEAPSDPALEAMIERTLMEVAGTRQLVVKRRVRGQRLGRDEVIERVMAKAERDIPKGVLDAQGDLLRGLGLMPADYDFVGGIYALLQRNVAGFYDEDSDTMFLLDDLGMADRETLVHELEHALQDQHFDLDRLVGYTPGESDRVTATHAIAEGDAMSTMFEVMNGNAFLIDAAALRFMMVASVAIVEGGQETPRVLQASLVAPYVDGYRFVQALRRRGGWTAVNEAFRTPPASTEQLLHLDKYDAREPPIVVGKPASPPGDGWVDKDADVLGEQGLRMVFEQWGRVTVAAEAAAGWGGDRYRVMERPLAQGGVEVAAAWLVVFDDDDEAKQAEELMRGAHDQACTAREVVGPFAYRRRGAAIAIVAGPFEKVDGVARASAGDCKGASAWLDSVLASR